MKSEVLNLGKHFLTIDSTISFELYNPVTQTTVKKASGRWVIDCWKLLTKEYFKENPQYVLELRYDESLLIDNNKIEWHTTDIDIGSIQSEYQLVTVANLETAGLAEEATLQTVAKESTLQTVAKESSLQDVYSTLEEINTSLVDSIEKYGTVSITSVQKTYYFKKDTLFIVGGSVLRADSNCVIQVQNGAFKCQGFFKKADGTESVYSTISQVVGSQTSFSYVGVML